MTYSQDTDYSLPPSNVVNYIRDKIPFLGSYYLFEVSENNFICVCSTPFGKQEVYSFSRSGSSYNNYYNVERSTPSEYVECSISNPMYCYSNVDGIIIEDYRSGSIADVGIFIALAFSLVFHFLGRFTRGKN